MKKVYLWGKGYFGRLLLALFVVAGFCIMGIKAEAAPNEYTADNPEYASREAYWNYYLSRDKEEEEFPADIWVGDFAYGISEYSKTATVIFYMGYEDTVINIPATFTYEGVTYTVTKIGYFHDWGSIYLEENTFPNYRNSFKGLVIPSTVKEIDKAAFYGMNISGKIVIPNTVKKIGEDAFQYNQAATEYVIGSGIKKIPEDCFWGNSNLKKVTIGKNVKTIGERAFRDCKLKQITIKSDKLERIDKDAFNCYKETKKSFIGLSRKIKVKAPKSKIESYKKLFNDSNGMDKIGKPNKYIFKKL